MSMGTFAVIGLPVLMPIVAILQLLFPGLLGERWRQYRAAITVLLTQSTVIFAHWAAVRWLPRSRGWWLRDDVLWAELVLTALIGAVVAGVAHGRSRRGTAAPIGRPTRLEYVAFGAIVATWAGRAAYLIATGTSPLDQFTVVALAAAAALGNLLVRGLAPAGARPAIRTESVFLWGLVLAGIGIGLYLERPDRAANAEAGVVAAEWPTFRGGEARTGSLDPADPGPTAPVLLWTFDPGERKGRVVFHSSPTVVDGQVYVGGLHEILTQADGVLYCINARAAVGGSPAPAPGALLWRFTAGDTLKPVYSSPTVAGGRVYLGEGYHQDHDCRLLCLDARRGDRALWTHATASHVESTATIAGGRIYFGAGDDGLIALGAAAAGRPERLWQVGKIHIDAPPLVVGDRLYVGSVAGDAYQELAILAVAARDGKPLWKIPSPLPAPDAPAYADGRVFVGLGNGKMDQDAEQPAGALWCLDAATGRRLWEAKAAAGVLGTPALMNGAVYFGSRDHSCRAVAQRDGKPLWQTDAGGPIVASPIAAGGKVYVLTVEGRLACLDGSTGRERWHLDLDVPDADAFSSPMLAGGRLYVAAGGKVLCLGDRQPP